MTMVTCPMSVWRRGGGSSSSSRAKPSSGANSDSEGVTSLQGKSSAPITPELARREKLELINEKSISNTKEFSTIKNRLGKIEEKINKLHKQSKTLFHE